MARDTVQNQANAAANRSRYADDPVAWGIYAEAYADGVRFALEQTAKLMREARK